MCLVHMMLQAVLRQLWMQHACKQLLSLPLPFAMKKVSLEARSSMGQGGTLLWCG